MWSWRNNTLPSCLKIGGLTASLFFVQPDPGFSSVVADQHSLVNLGILLFFDPRLSEDNDLSCASCHIPEKAYTDGRQLARGKGGRRLTRNTPTLLNVAENSTFFWDGRTRSLEAQILEVMQNKDEMNIKPISLEAKLNQVPEYVSQFQDIYGTPVTIVGITYAIAAFEKTLITGQASFDRFLYGDMEAMTPSAQRGMALFQDEAKCAFCHKGFTLTDFDFHNIGVPPLPIASGRKNSAPEDVGRFGVTRHSEDRGSFKTPSLRNVAQTAPYMHNGVMETLAEVIEFYNKGGGKNPNLDVQIEPLGLTKEEKKDLVEFLIALTSDYPIIKKPNLPGTVPLSH